jgi:flagellar basal-body rod modification protein FlgD
MTTITGANAAANAAATNNTNSTTSSGSSAANSLGMTATDFLKLLTTQLTNQDPLNPTDPSQFTNQLAQINMVEQETQVNQTLSQMLAAQGTSTMSMGVSYIGKEVLAPGNSFSDSSGQSVNLAYKMPAGAAAGTIAITDSQGNVVYTGTPSFTQGITNFTWNGQTNSGATAPSGTYHLQVSALSASGQPLNVTSYTPGLVSGLETGSDGSLQLVVGNTTVPISSVIGVSMPPT